MGERLYSVYMHITPSDKRYIGITCCKVNARWKGGSGYSYNTHFYSAINKYGWDNIEHSILASNLSKEDAIKMEIELISKHNSTDPKFGYNITLGGGTSVPLCGEKNGMFGRTHSPEVRERLKNSALERFSDKTRHPMYGTHRSDETKLKLSKSHNGLLSGDKCHFYGKHLFGKDSPHYGIHHSEETKVRLSEIRKGRFIGALAYNAREVMNVESGEVFACAMDVRRKYGYDNSCVSKCCKNQKHIYKGSHWSYTASPSDNQL